MLWSVGGSLSEITLYSGHTSAPKVASQFSPWKNPESNVSNYYLLEQKYWQVSSRFQFSFCPLMEFLFIVGSERSATIKLTQVWPKVTWGSPITPQYLKPSKQTVQNNPESFTTYSAIGQKKNQTIYGIYYFTSSLQLWLFISKRGEHWKWFQICGEAPGAGGDAFGCASKFPVSHHPPQ